MTAAEMGFLASAAVALVAAVVCAVLIAKDEYEIGAKIVLGSVGGMLGGVFAGIVCFLLLLVMSGIYALGAA